MRYIIPDPEKRTKCATPKITNILHGGPFHFRRMEEAPSQEKMNSGRMKWLQVEEQSNEHTERSPAVCNRGNPGVSLTQGMCYGENSTRQRMITGYEQNSTQAHTGLEYI